MNREARMQKLLENRLNEVLAEFSLDQEASAMSRLKAMLDDGFLKINRALGVEEAVAAEAARGHVKGIEDCAKELKDDLDRRLNEVLHVLRRGE